MSEQMQGQIQVQQPTIVADVPPNAEVIEIKKMVNNITEKIDSISSGIAAFTQYINTIKVLSIILESIGVWKCSLCKMNMNGVCTGWRLPEDLSSSLRGMLGEGTIVQQDGIYRFRVDRLPYIGAICPIYIQR